MMIDILFILLGFMMGYAVKSYMENKDIDLEFESLEMMLETVIGKYSKLLDDLEKYGVEWYSSKGEIKLRKKKK